MRSMINITITAGADNHGRPLFELNEGYRVVETTALERYDYPYVIQVTDTHRSLSRDGETMRLLLIPDQRFEYQTLRYSSGLYYWHELTDDWALARIAEMVADNMRRREEPV